MPRIWEDSGRLAHRIAQRPLGCYTTSTPAFQVTRCTSFPSFEKNGSGWLTSLIPPMLALSCASYSFGQTHRFFEPPSHFLSKPSDHLPALPRGWEEIALRGPWHSLPFSVMQYRAALVCWGRGLQLGGLLGNKISTLFSSFISMSSRGWLFFPNSPFPWLFIWRTSRMPPAALMCSMNTRTSGESPCQRHP